MIESVLPLLSSQILLINYYDLPGNFCGMYTADPPPVPSVHQFLCLDLEIDRIRQFYTEKRNSTIVTYGTLTVSK